MTTAGVLAAATAGTLAVAAVVVAAGSLAPAAAVPARPGARPGPDAPVIRVGGTALARGQVVTLSGRPVAGQEVELLSWPGAALALTRRPVPQKVLATAVTSADGRFSLVPRRAGPLLDAAAHGPVNLEVLAVGGGGGLASFAFTRVVRAAGGRLRVSPLRHQGQQATPAWALLRVRAAAPLAAGASACTVRVTRRYGAQWTTVGQAFANVRGAWVQFSYGRGQPTELGVASSADGRPGTFHPAGTLTERASAAQRFPARAGPVRALYQTRFRFAELEQSCAPPDADRAPAHRFLIAATGFAGGTAMVATPKPPRALYCVPFSAGSTFTLYGTAAVLWPGGVTIAAAAGVRLSAQTGYTHTASVSFRFTRAMALCGTAGFPGSHPGELVARAAA